MSLTSPAFADGFFTTSSTTWETLFTEVCVCAKLVQPCPWWAVAHLSMGYWGGLPFPSSSSQKTRGQMSVLVQGEGAKGVLKI